MDYSSLFDDLKGVIRTTIPWATARLALALTCKSELPFAQKPLTWMGIDEFAKAYVRSPLPLEGYKMAYTACLKAYAQGFPYALLRELVMLEGGYSEYFTDTNRLHVRQMIFAVRGYDASAHRIALSSPPTISEKAQYRLASRLYLRTTLPDFESMLPKTLHPQSPLTNSVINEALLVEDNPELLMRLDRSDFLPTMLCDWALRYAHSVECYIVLAGPVPDINTLFRADRPWPVVARLLEIHPVDELRAHLERMRTARYAFPSTIGLERSAQPERDFCLAARGQEGHCSSVHGIMSWETLRALLKWLKDHHAASNAQLCLSSGCLFLREGELYCKAHTPKTM
jgi:hypothetical protein